VKHLRAADLKERITYLDRIKQSEILILDDLAIINEWSNFIYESYYELFDYRYSHNLRTIITSNFQIHDLSKRIKSDNRELIDRILRRISEICETKINIRQKYWLIKLVEKEE